MPQIETLGILYEGLVLSTEPYVRMGLTTTAVNMVLVAMFYQKSNGDTRLGPQINFISKITFRYFALGES